MRRLRHPHRHGWAQPGWQVMDRLRAGCPTMLGLPLVSWARNTLTKSSNLAEDGTAAAVQTNSFGFSLCWELCPVLRIGRCCIVVARPRVLFFLCGVFALSAWAESPKILD